MLNIKIRKQIIGENLLYFTIWTIVFLLDVAAVFGIAYLIGIPLPTGAFAKIGLILYLVVAFALFCLESIVYNKIIE